MAKSNFGEIKITNKAEEIIQEWEEEGLIIATISAEEWNKLRMDWAVKAERAIDPLSCPWYPG